jgi:hypothetical protein
MSDFSLFDKPQGPKKWVRTRELASKNGFWGAKPKSRTQDKSRTQAKKPIESQTKLQSNVVQSNVVQSTQTKSEIEPEIEPEIEQSNTSDSWDD